MREKNVPEEREELYSALCAESQRSGRFSLPGCSIARPRKSRERGNECGPRGKKWIFVNGIFLVVCVDFSLVN